MKKALVLLALLALSCATAFSAIRVTSPNGGQSWRCGERHPITWTTSGCGDRVKIELISGVATTLLTERTGNVEGNNSWTWTIAADTSPRTDYKVKITVVRGTACSDQSDANFAIQCAPVALLTVSSPNGSENWTRDSSQAISWTYSGIPDTALVKIILFKDGLAPSNQVGVIAQNRPIGSAGTGSYGWTVGRHEGGTAAAATGYFISVADMNGTFKDESNNSFSIVLIPTGVLTPPKKIPPKPIPIDTRTDLEITDIFLSGAPPNFNLNVKAKNWGAAFSGTTTVLVEGPCLPAQISHVEHLDLDSREETSFDVALLPESTLLGAECGCEFRAEIDPFNAVAEGNEGNNVRRKSIYKFNRCDGRLQQPVYIGKTGSKIAAVQGTTIVITPSHADRVEGDEIYTNLFVTLKNCGDQPVPTSLLRITQSWFDTSYMGPASYSEDADVARLEPGQTIDMVIPFKLYKASPAGSYELMVYFLVSCPEPDSANNYVWFQFQLSGF